LGIVPNHLLVDGSFVYVVNSASGTLQVLKQKDASIAPKGAGEPMALTTIGEVNFGENSNPQAVARLGDALYVTLYGGFESATLSAGQKVAKVDVSNPLLPTVVQTFDLSGLDLKPFPNQNTVARPAAIVAHREHLYIGLQNLSGTVPGGPGLLAKIDPVTQAISTLPLGEHCLNVSALVSTGSHLLASCAGKSNYDESYNTLNTEAAGLVVLDENDSILDAVSLACPADSPAFNPATKEGCRPVVPGRFAVANGKIYLGDQNGGRLFVLQLMDGKLVQLRGYAPEAAQPVQVCPFLDDPAINFSNVADVLVVP
jgi:hypothetical protein